MLFTLASWSLKHPLEKKCATWFAFILSVSDCGMWRQWLIEVVPFKPAYLRLVFDSSEALALGKSKYFGTLM